MSKSTLSTLKSEINMEMKSISSTSSTLKALEKSISNAMYDKVGASAVESISQIENRFYCNLEKGYKSADNAANALSRGYSKLDSLSEQGENYLSQAKSIVKGIGEI